MQQASQTPSTRAERIARLIVLDMVITPGLLFFGVVAFMAYQSRANLGVVAVIVVGFLFAASVGPAQWGTMLRVAGIGRASNQSRSGVEEDTPRLTSRGMTANANPTRPPDAP